MTAQRMSQGVQPVLQPGVDRYTAWVNRLVSFVDGVETRTAA
jgi:hypothetical protein